MDLLPPREVPSLLVREAEKGGGDALCLLPGFQVSCVRPDAVCFRN